MQDKNGAFPHRPATGPLRMTKSSMPLQLTPLIGRESELAQSCTLLRRPEVRLVTLTGTGGVGKTRLGLAVAHTLLEEFADGVCFVSLAPVSDPERVMPAIAQALGLWEAGDRPLEERMQDYLQEKHLLLLLDNFEQVVSAAVQIVGLLAACPQLKVMVTSREMLHVRAEHEFPVPPLTVPDLARLSQQPDFEQVAAVRLFVERACAIQSTFQLNPANARTVAGICASLDGLPLAIELAAARIKLLPPPALLSRLSHRLELLTRGASDLPARQQTLRNTLQWSYDLLSKQEQRLFRWLSVFVGGCTLEAIEAAHHIGNGGEMEVLEGVASLLDKNLVQQTEQEGEEPRLLLLETIREYGLLCLQELSELEAARRVHADYYLALAEEAFRHLTSAQAITWLERLEQERENLLAALQWGLERKDKPAGEAGSGIELAARLNRVLSRFWGLRGYLSEGRAVTERVLHATEGSEIAVRQQVLFAAATLTWYQSEYARLEEICRESLSLGRQVGYYFWTGETLLGLAEVALHRRDYAQARTLAGEALEIEDTWVAATTRLFLGRLASAQGDYPEAEAQFEQSLLLYRTLGYQGEIAWPLIYLARNLITQAAYPRAHKLLEEGLALFSEAGNKWGLAHALGLLGQVTLEQGNVVAAKDLLTSSLQLNQEVGNQRSIAQSLFLLAGVVELQANHREAQALYEQSLSIATALEHRGLIASCLEGLAAVVTAQERPAWAARLWGAAQAMRENMRQSRVLSLPQAMRVRVEQARAAACTQLGEKAFNQALAEGRKMSPEQALSAHLPIEIRQSPTSPTPASRQTPAYPAGLTAREVDVLRLVAQGLTDAQVAEKLVVSPRTVTTHLTSIYNKLGVNSRAAATRFAVEHQLI